jgi:NAD(P)-dependent dehydrogenase (short-subunit alcohol dehydrogenase family)
MRTVLITGANKSIGFETARQMRARGYFVYLGSRDLVKGQEAAAKLRSEGVTQVEALQIDVSDPESIKAARAKVQTLDVLINNAGISGGFPQTALGTPTATIRKVFDTNVFGPIDVTSAFMDLLRQSPEPRIVNVTSGLASLTLHSDPAWKYYPIKGAAYGPSKTALNAYTVVLAYELKDTPFKVNLVDPGYTATDFNHHNGPGSVEDAASLIVKYATIGADGPTGRFFSNDYKQGGESPW